MPIIMPTPPVRPLTAAKAGAVAKRARGLLRSGKITHRGYALVDCLLWSCRAPGTGAITVSYTALSRLVHVARGTIAAALRQLEALGVVTKIRRRIRIAWHQGGTSSRVASRLAAEGLGATAIADRLSIGRGSVYRILDEAKAAQQPAGEAAG